MNPIRQKIVDLCYEELGTKESPAGSNKVAYNQWFYNDGHPYFKNSKPYAWCGTFCAWVYNFSDLHLTSEEFKHISYVPSIQNHWQRKERFTQNPQPGDAVIYDWNKDGFEEHIGIFIKWVDRKKGTFVAIEGNTSPDEKGSQSNGGMVCEKERNIKYVAAFAVPEMLDMVKGI